MADLQAPFRIDRTPLIGRARQRTALAGFLQEARSGRPAVVLLTGEPGIGKTRLLEELAAGAGAEDITVMRGSASEAEGMPPYLPFLEAVGDYMAAAPLDLLREQAGMHGPSLAAVFPEIPARLGPLAPAYPLGHEQERFRLYEAVTGFLAAIAAHRPVLLVLDDLQWIDTASCDLLVHVAGRARSSPVLIVGAYREGELGENRDLAAAITELNRRRLLTIVPVESLAAEEAVALAASLLGADIEPTTADLLRRQSEGNPFFLEELVRVLVEDGTLVQRHGRWELRSGAEPALHAGHVLPPRVVEAIRLRLDRLTPEVVELLRTAAVVGRTWELELLTRVEGRNLAQVEEMVQEAVRGQLARPNPDGTFGFTHDMVREALYADVGMPRRKRLHQAIGEALEVDGDAPSPRRLADLAFHFGQSGDVVRGVTYAVAAGEHALAASAATEAMAYYQTALRLLGPDGDAERRGAALAGRGRAAQLAGEYAMASEHYDAAKDAWLRAGNAVAAAQAWRELGEARWRQEEVIEAEEAFACALDLLGPDDSPEATLLLLRLADLQVTSLGRHAEGMTHAERALAMVDRLDDRLLQAQALCVVGNIKARGNDPAGRGALERALALARELDDPALAAQACAYLANVCAWTGDLNRSRELTLLRADLARRTHDPFELRDVYAWLGGLDALQGNWSQAEEWFARQEELIAGLQSDQPTAILGAHRAPLHYYQGQFTEAERLYRTTIAFVRRANSSALVWYLGQLGLVLAYAGRRDDALRCFAELHALAESQEEQASARLCAFTYLAVGYAKLGERQRAAGCYPLLLPFRGQLAPIPVDRALGLAALCAGDTEAAQRHLSDAEAQARKAGLLPEVALILLERGVLDERLRSGRGAPPARPADGTEGPLAEGLRLCEALGVQELGRLTIEGEPDRPAGSRRDARVAGLTSRELDVLRLVAQGRTNREIAKTLFLSQHTVARHLTHIFTKTGVENRVGAASFALRHNLT